MAVAAGLMSVVIVLLEVFLDFEVSAAKRTYTEGQGLTVHLRQKDADSDPERVSGEQTDDIQVREIISVAEISTAPDDPTPAIAPASRPDERSAIDWRKMITESVAAIGDERVGQEASRSSMWRQSHSIMFQPEREPALRELDPILPNFRFKPQVYVAGLGITIGSCFVGIPIIGVPVEQRTVAISLFVCAKGSG